MPVKRKKDPNSYYHRLTLLKKLLWLYFFLLIFEGALRKWVVPELTAPLLIIRDPLSLLIIWEAYRTHKWPARWSAVVALLTAGFVGLLVVQLIGGLPWFVGLYGLRSYLLPFPVIFIMGENLDEEDLHRLGACTLWLLLPNVALEVAQYLSPSNSFLNAGSTEAGRQITYVGARVRASGTFSFVTGSTYFGALAGAFLFYGLAKPGFAKTWLLWVSAFALILSVPVIGSRTLVFELAGILACVGVGAIFGMSQFAKTIKLVLPVAIITGLISFLPLFTQAMSDLNARWNEAAADEGNTRHVLVMRTLDPIVSTFEQTDFAQDLTGVGMGRGAVAVTALTSSGAAFSFGELEITREILELGPIVGAAFFLFRVLLAILLCGQALKQARDQRPLALLLLPMSISLLVMCTMEQPTEQGFMVIGVAFLIAALRVPEQRSMPLAPLDRYSRPVRVHRRLQPCEPLGCAAEKSVQL